MKDPYFWKKKEAKEKVKKLKLLEKEVKKIKELKKEADDLLKLSKISGKELEKEIKKRVKDLEKEIKEEEKKKFFVGKYDKNSAILTIIAGAGGREAEDWVAMLKRMYEKYLEKKGYKIKIVDILYGEGGGPKGRIGIKKCTLLIEGPYAYGLLKKENGVHRLVRISPFSSAKLRHTSFALVEILPEIKESREIVLKPEELKIEFFRASGPGGQYVNRRETAVRITHLPTGISASCQSERSQRRNREIATKLLLAKLLKLKERERKKELQKLKGGKISIEWGNQIRSYILDPYQLVKDLRTKIELKNAEEVLEGNLDPFLYAEIKENDKVRKRL